MITIKDLKEFANTPKTKLTRHLECKYRSMLKEYNCSMQDIGEVQIFDDLNELFKIYGDSTLNSFEVVEIVGGYLHLVQLVDDYYAKDIYVPIREEVI